MNDTPEAKKIQDELFSKLTGSQRIEMASGMFDAARQIVLASLPKDLSKKEKNESIIFKIL